MNTEEAKEKVRKENCQTCGSQRCFGQDGWIESCEHYCRLMAIKGRL